MPVADSISVRGIPVSQSFPVTLVIRDGRIIAHDVQNAIRNIDLGDDECYFAPLLFDAQVNGGFGVSVQDDKLDADQLLRLSEHLRQTGVVRWIPTVVTNALERMEHICRTISESIRRYPELRRAMPGIHLEGPWISPEDGPRGAHPCEFVREPSVRDWEKLYRASNGAVAYVTLAPERKQALSLIRRIRADGVKVSLGHHNASPEVMLKAVEAGAELCTHIGNGIGNWLHRHLNPIWFALAEDRLSVSVIADGHHLPGYVMRVIAKAKGVDNIVLVSDATQFLGMRPGRYSEFGATVRLYSNRKLCLEGTPYLAGSASPLLDCVLQWHKATSLPLMSCFRSASAVPARLFGVSMPRWRLKVGSQANGILFRWDRETDRVRVLAVFHGG